MDYQNKFWERYFEYYDVLNRVIPYQNLLKKLVSSLKLSSKSKVLDLGSGTGNIQNFMTGKVEVVSIDNSQAALDRLVSKFPDAVVIKHSIVDRLPFEDNTFDRIVSNNVLYTLHESQWDKVILELRRVSKPNGLIVVSNLNDDFKAINIYKDHIRKSIKEIGIIKTVFELVTLLYPTIRMLQFNKRISESNSAGNYSFLTDLEQQNRFAKYKLLPIKETELVYSNQAYLDVFINKKANVEY